MANAVEAPPRATPPGRGAPEEAAAGTTRWWVWFAAVGGLPVLGYTFFPRGIVQDFAYVGIGLSSLAAIVAGVGINRPVRRSPWYLMAAGQLLWVVGDAVGSWNTDVRHVDSFPSLADAFYMIAYPVIAAGLLALIRGRRTGRDVAGLIDSATVTAGLGLLSWTVLAHPAIANSSDSVPTAAVGVAYPVADILLVGLLILLVTTPGGRTPSFRLLLTAVSLLVAGDTASSALSLFSASSTNSIDFLWLLSYLAWGAAALHPSMTSLSEPTADENGRFSRRRLGALVLATMIAPGVLAVQRALGARLDVWAVVISSVLMFGLVVARMNLAIRQIIAANRDRERLQEDLVYQASHDSLTGLPNRARATALIEAALSRVQRTGGNIGLLFIDLDGFKKVNDTAGHRAGDRLLRVTAERLQAHVRGGDTVARLGGDEFIVLLEPLDDVRSAVAVANRLVASVSEAVTLADGTDAHVGASIGVAVGQDVATNVDLLLHEADIAAYRAKAAGRGRVEVFDASLRRDLEMREDAKRALHHAIDHDELVLHYQPIVRVKSGRVEGYEALVRWQRPDYGLLPPARFIPIAEQSELICDLERWVLDTATHQLSEWTRDGGSLDLRISINISARHVVRPCFVGDVIAAIRRSGIAAHQLRLEVTEAALADSAQASAHLYELRRIGVTVSLDNFGTKYNTLGRLRDMPIDIIKVDRQFLRSGDARPEILQLIVTAVHALGLPVVAEGVEQAEQLNTIRGVGCESAQGFFLGRPMSLDDVERFRTSRHDDALAVD